MSTGGGKVGDPDLWGMTYGVGRKSVFILVKRVDPDRAKTSDEIRRITQVPRPPFATRNICFPRGSNGNVLHHRGGDGQDALVGVIIFTSSHIFWQLLWRTGPVWSLYTKINTTLAYFVGRCKFRRLTRPCCMLTSAFYIV